MPRSSKTKSKNGCTTCKVRRVKCGEEKPACLRCVSTGRVCDGYGIWGGGGNTYEERYRPQASESSVILAKQATPSPVCLKVFPVCSASDLDTDEKYHFEWFWLRTSRKVHGAFYTDVANALLFQACNSDTAITHAILAVSSAHKASDRTSMLIPKPTSLQGDEDFALRQYNKAIKFLRPHLKANDLTSVRIALFACVTFIWVEWFRSHYQTAADHLEHGLKMLVHATHSSKSNMFCNSLIDDWLRSTFRKLYVQSTLFGQQPHQPWPLPDTLKPIWTISIFASAHEGREYLENLLVEICELTDAQAKQHYLQSAEVNSPKSLAMKTRKISNDLQSWIGVYERTFILGKDTMDKVEAFAFSVLRMYHTMATIMADTICDSEESKYDRHTASFLSIINQGLAMLKVATNTDIRRRYFGDPEGLPHSIGDAGPLGPLFYVAVKCRIHRFRIHAINFLQQEPRKEGIHDSFLLVSIARRIMAIEEGSLSWNDLCSDDSSMVEVLQTDTKLVPILPESSRVQILQILLPNAPWIPVILKCRHRGVIQHYNIMHGMQWISPRKQIPS